MNKTKKSALNIKSFKQNALKNKNINNSNSLKTILKQSRKSGVLNLSGKCIGEGLYLYKLFFITVKYKLIHLKYPMKSGG